MGYVYFITYDSKIWREVLPFVKIGFTNNLERRIKALSTGSPVALLLAGYIETNCQEELEEWIHGELGLLGARVNGEWFKVNSRSMELLDRLEKDIKENKIKKLFSPEKEKCDEAFFRNIITKKDERIRELEKANNVMRYRLIDIDPLAYKYIPNKSIRPRGLKTSKRLSCKHTGY